MGTTDTSHRWVVRISDGRVVTERSEDPDGATDCAIRMRSHDDHDSVLEAPDLVPTLLELLLSTFQSSAAAERHETDRQDQ